MDFFPSNSRLKPCVYAIERTDSCDYAGFLKICYTTGDVEEEVSKRYRSDAKRYKVVFKESALLDDGTTFTDKQVMAVIRQRPYEVKGDDWVRCTVIDVKSSILAFKYGIESGHYRTLNYGMRSEQRDAVMRTKQYYSGFKKRNPEKAARFIWNVKSGFGKHFATFQLIKSMRLKTILILTFRPAATASLWKETMESHVDFEGWQYGSHNGLTFDESDKSRPFVYFASFREYFEKCDFGTLKSKDQGMRGIKWDLVVFDEFNTASWSESTSELFATENRKERYYQIGEGMELFKHGFDEENLPLSTSRYLYLSETPLELFESGEFRENQIYNWTYIDEQIAKESWNDDNSPYAGMPRMVLMTYQLPEFMKEVAFNSVSERFDFDELFSTEGDGKSAVFKHFDEVQWWLDAIRGYFEDSEDDDKADCTKHPPLPYSDTRLLKAIDHSVWLLPKASSCYAMARLLELNRNRFYHDYKVIVATGPGIGVGADASKSLKSVMQNPLNCRSITLTCGKLMGGVSIRPWSAIFILRNISNLESYFQAAFQVQFPWVMDGTSYSKVPVKKECYVFDFDPSRISKLVIEYNCRFGLERDNLKERVSQFIRLLPLLVFDGKSMKQLDVDGALDCAKKGITFTDVNKGWEKDSLVNVDDGTLSALVKDNKTMHSLMQIELFRNLDQDLETILQISEKIRRVRKAETNPKTTEKRELNKEERDMLDKRNALRKRFIRLLNRLQSLLRVETIDGCIPDIIIPKIDPRDFRKRMWMGVDEFRRLFRLGIYNAHVLNPAIFEFVCHPGSGILNQVTSLCGRDNESFENAIACEDRPETSLNECRSELINDPGFNEGQKERAHPNAFRMSVTQRVKSVKQPWGGYINPRSMSTIQFDDGKCLGPENINPGIVGTVVDYLTRIVNGDRINNVFCYAIAGGIQLDRSAELSKYLSKINGLNVDSIRNACRACTFDAFYRSGYAPSDSLNKMIADAGTCKNIRIMVNRTLSFFKEYGPIVKTGITFEGGYTDVVSNGDGDYLTSDTVWDLKITKKPLNKNHTLQLAMYYLMGKHSNWVIYDSVTKIGVFNPRENVAHILDMRKVPQDIIEAIEKDVICYTERNRPNVNYPIIIQYDSYGDE